MKRTLQTILIVIGLFFSLCGVYCLFGNPKLFYSSLGDIIYSIPVHNLKGEIISLRKELTISGEEKQKLSSGYNRKLDEEKSLFTDYRKHVADKNVQVFKKCLDDIANRSVNAGFIKKITEHVVNSDIIDIDTADKILRLTTRNRVIYQEKLECYFSLFQLKKAIPVLEIRKGAFSFWKVYGIVNDSVGFAIFSLLINENQMRIIKRNFLMNLEGVWFRSSSPSGRYFMMDYGCCPGIRELEIFDEFGYSIHKSKYTEDGCTSRCSSPFWSGDTLIYWKPVNEYTISKDSMEVVKLCGKERFEAAYLKRARFYKNREIVSDSGRVYCF